MSKLPATLSFPTLIFSACLVAAGTSLAPVPAQAQPQSQTHTARLIHLTTDGTANGQALFPGFRTHSVWNALGVSSQGHVYVAVSNHYQPGGNVAVCKYDPVTDRITALGDLKAVSTAASNWMAAESQYKVHTFLQEHADGKLYLATDDHHPTPFLRGAHVYTIDPATDKIVDFSKTQPYLMDKSLKVIQNTGKAAERSGVFIEYYGIKGISLNRRAPGVMYAMTYPDGHVIRYDTKTGGMSTIGRSAGVNFIFYTDNSGNAYYARQAQSGLALVKYVQASGKTVTIKASFPGVDLGAMAPTQSGEIVYCLVADTLKVYRLDCRNDTFTELTTLCGTNWWRVYNLSLSPDGRFLYYVSNNNSRSTICRIDLATKVCTEVLDVDKLLGTRNLCFGGVNVWDQSARFYTAVWTYPDTSDVALLQVTTDAHALVGSPQSLSVSSGGTQKLALTAGPDNAEHTYLLLGSLGGTGPGLESNGLTLPLRYPDIYLDYTFWNPNSPLLQSSAGKLDSNGAATASFRLPPGLGALLGLKVHHAFAVLNQVLQVVFTSNPVPVTMTR